MTIYRYAIILLFFCLFLGMADSDCVFAQGTSPSKEKVSNAVLSATGWKRIPPRQSPPVEKRPIAVDQKLLRWIETNVSPRTELPLSFYISEENKKAAYEKMGKVDSIPGIIERMTVAEGFSIYDAAVRDILLTLLGSPENLAEAYRPLKIYWDGQLDELRNIRAGYPIQPYMYNPQDPEAVTSDVLMKGRRGFIFRLLNANGRYNTKDPIDGKTHFPGYPNWPTIHWEDWKPIAGENAWVVLAAMQLYHKKYFDPQTQSYSSDGKAVELLLAKELARVALLLQADNGGIRMAPLGTYYHLVNFTHTDSLEEIDRELNERFKRTKYLSFEDKKDRHTLLEAFKQEEYNWYYNSISTENNISWYAAFRALYRVTKNPLYANAMRRIEDYLETVWNDQEKYFYQGVHFHDG